jgi:hypothetical protein
MSDKDPEHSALSRRERVCINALLGIYLAVLVFAASIRDDVADAVPRLAEEWSQSVQAGLRGRTPDLFNLLQGAALSLFLVGPCLGIAFAVHRLGVRSLIRLRHLWWAAVVHGGGYLLLAAVFVRYKGNIYDNDIVFMASLSVMLTLAIIGLRATRARERAEQA